MCSLSPAEPGVSVRQASLSVSVCPIFSTSCCRAPQATSGTQGHSIQSTMNRTKAQATAVPSCVRTVQQTAHYTACSFFFLHLRHFLRLHLYLLPASVSSLSSVNNQYAVCRYILTFTLHSTYQTPAMSAVVLLYLFIFHQ